MEETSDETHSTIVDLAQVILEKVQFLGQNKEQMTPIHMIGVQTEVCIIPYFIELCIINCLCTVT